MRDNRRPTGITIKNGEDKIWQANSSPHPHIDPVNARDDALPDELEQVPGGDRGFGGGDEVQGSDVNQ